MEYEGRRFWGCCFLLPLFINSRRLWNCRGKEGAVLGGFNASDLFQRLKTISGYKVKPRVVAHFMFEACAWVVIITRLYILRARQFVALSINVIIEEWTIWLILGYSAKMPFTKLVFSLPPSSCKQDITSGLNRVYEYSVVIQFRDYGFMLVFNRFSVFLYKE